MVAQSFCEPERLPLGLTKFSNLRSSQMIYVDKTELLYKIARQRVPIFLSRPRRFGKSLLINTLASLFANGLEYFHGLNIEKMWNDTTYNVVQIDFSIFAADDPFEFKRDFVDTLIFQFNRVNSIEKIDSLGIRNPNTVFSEIAESLSENSTVLLIDEYDAPLTHHLDNADELKKIMSILNNFYAALKKYTDKFRFIFITGITRVSYVSIFSAFNNLRDLSLHDEFNTFLGFTKNDLVRYFDEYIDNAAYILHMTKDEVYKRIEQYYDGFQFSLHTEETLYNPWSILNFLESPQ